MDNEHSIQKKVLERIRSGKVRVRPRAYFVLRLASIIAVALAVLVISVFVVSFVIFSIHESGEQFLLGFGGRGILTFLRLFPWFILFFDVGLIILLGWLIQEFRFAYRVSLASVLAGIVIVSTLLGSLVAVTPFHSDLLERADHEALPLLGGLYKSIHDSHAEEGVFRGTVISVGENEILVAHEDNDRDADDGVHRVLLPKDSPPLSVGDRVYVLFSSAGEELYEAHGIGRFPDRQ